jgi:hypothetical protein
MEGKSASNQHKGLKGLSKEGLLIPLTSLDGSFVGLPASAAALAYSEGLAAVESLAASSGKTSIRNILDMMGQNLNFASAFQSVLNKSVAQFDAQWRESLKQ